MDIYKRIIESDDSYWVLARETSYRDMGETKRGHDDIIFVAIPQTIRRNTKYENILLKDIETLEKASMDCNIFLSEDFSPFQIGQSFRNVYDGFPIAENIKEFAIRAMSTSKHELSWYQEMYKKLNK